MGVLEKSWIFFVSRRVGTLPLAHWRDPPAVSGKFWCLDLTANGVALDPQGRGNRESGVSNDPPEIYLGVKLGILTPPKFFGKKYFLVHTHTESTS